MWNPAHIPDQNGRTAVVTGANTGLGLETARELARRDATVIVAARNADKGKAAIEDIRDSVPGADVSLLQLDLSSLDQIAEAADELHRRVDSIDLLVNNAGVMMTPYSTTADGFELQLGTNHLGHFAFTGRVLDLMTDVEGSRIVNVASNAHKFKAMPYTRESITGDVGYDRTGAYARSKLANLLFTYALDRRLQQADAKTIVLAAHPGVSATELSRNLPRLIQPLLKVFEPLMSQPPQNGAHPQLRAATDPEATRGQYYGPSGFQELRGAAVVVESRRRSHDEGLQEELWTMSEDLTGVTYDLPSAA